ncbi:polyadenylate-binding protein-interacting protein 7 [Curcuma longa]|uniref:polyadenylate-binding protein-interacting protein 7 n=1 Tax=Curcuma longa TaxID=136217 RepID=UPI003D9EE4F1
MNSNKGLADSWIAKSSSLNKVTALNPNAAEFVPSSLKYTYETTKILDATKLDHPGSSRKAVLDRSESNTSNNSDDEVHQYWRQQLPDDITPDFEVIGEALREPGHLTLAGLSINDNAEQSKFPGSMTSQILDMRQDLSSPTIRNVSLSGKMEFPGSIYAKEQSSIARMTSMANAWGKSFVNDELQDRHTYDSDLTAGSMGDNIFLENSVTDPIEFLSSQFPGFAAQSLADIYYGNGCDLNLTIEILTQLELQVDSNFDPNGDSNPLGAPNFSPLDFPALPVADSQNGLPKYGDNQHGSDSYRSPAISKGEIDFASTVRKLASQDSGHWKFERNGSADVNAGSSRSSHLLGSTYNGNTKTAYGDKWSSSSAVRSSPVWLETGDAVANIYSETREEARDLARLRNACFDQARQAYLIGNKALAKELSFKGQLYNMHMKAAHEKAKEEIYRKRNKSQSYGGEQDRLIDLHGLHVTEALQVLNHELRTLRSTARATRQRLHVMICVGTGHHTKGSRTPVRLPVAVEQYLLKEGIRFSQPQPGLLSVVIY